MTLYGGMDLHANNSVIALLDEGHGSELKHHRLTNRVCLWWGFYWDASLSTAPRMSEWGSTLGPPPERCAVRSWAIWRWLARPAATLPARIPAASPFP